MASTYANDSNYVQISHAPPSNSDGVKGRMEKSRAVREGRSKREGEIVLLIVIGWRVQMRILEESII